MRKRRGSLLAALERIGRRDEEEEEPEAFHLPQREEETGFSLNKCILGAIILLGLGTIFFSGRPRLGSSRHANPMSSCIYGAWPLV